MKTNTGGVHLLAINFRSCDYRIMAARFQLQGNRDVWMHIAERAKHRKDYAFTAHLSEARFAGRTALTSPARTIRTAPSEVSTRNAPSHSKPRVTPSNDSLASTTLTSRSYPYDELAHHS